jgi:SAM-dependent methyltransferase
MELTPVIISRMLGGCSASYVLKTVIDLDAFTLISKGINDTKAIAKETGTGERAIAILLDTLQIFELIHKQDGKYHLTPISETYLVRGKDTYMGYFRFTFFSMLPGLWRLKEVLKSGKALEKLDLEDAASNIWEGQALGLSVMTAPSATCLAQILKEKGITGIKILDFGGGSGIFGATLTQDEPKNRAVQLDLPGVNHVAKEFLKNRGVDLSRMEFWDGDCLTYPLPEEKFDLIILSNICHFEDRMGNVNLFKRMWQALRKNGYLAINDFFLDEDGLGPRFSFMFRIFMLANTQRGGVYPISDYQYWLEEAGYREISFYYPLLDVYEGVGIILAKK